MIRRFGSAAKALAALPDLARRGGRAVSPKIPSRAEADRELEAGARLGAVLIASREAAYPARLAALDPPPPIPWTRGDPALQRRPAIAIVGARIASAAGQRFARDLARQVGLDGLGVISGMAQAVDRRGP